jgi:hypothetical protein
MRKDDATNAINYAHRAQSQSTVEGKIDELAKAIACLAEALLDISQAVDRS